MPKVFVESLGQDVEFEDDWSYDEILDYVRTHLEGQPPAQPKRQGPRTPLLDRAGLTGAEVRRRAAANEPILQEGEGLRRPTKPETAGLGIAGFATAAGKGLGGLVGLAADVPRAAAAAAMGPMGLVRETPGLFNPRDPMPASRTAEEAGEDFRRTAHRVMGIEEDVAGQEPQLVGAEFAVDAAMPGPEVVGLMRLLSTASSTKALVEAGRSATPERAQAAIKALQYKGYKLTDEEIAVVMSSAQRHADAAEQARWLEREELTPGQLDRLNRGQGYELDEVQRTIAAERQAARQQAEGWISENQMEPDEFDSAAKYGPIEPQGERLPQRPISRDLQQESIRQESEPLVDEDGAPIEEPLLPDDDFVDTEAIEANLPEPLLPPTRDNIKQVFGLSDEQADAVDRLVSGMALDRSKIQVRKGSRADLSSRQYESWLDKRDQFLEMDPGQRQAYSERLNGQVLDEVEDPSVEVPDWLRGFVSFEEDGRAVITAMKSAQVSTAIHEFMHVGRKHLFSRGIDPELRIGISDQDIALAEDALGVKDGVWTREAEEGFARGAESYLATGQAPTPALKRVYEAFKQWLREIYGRLVNSPIQDQVSPEMRAVFDKLFTRDERLKRPIPRQQPLPTAFPDKTLNPEDLQAWLREGKGGPVPYEPPDPQAAAAGLKERLVRGRIKLTPAQEAELAAGLEPSWTNAQKIALKNLEILEKADAEDAAREAPKHLLAQYMIDNKLVDPTAGQLLSMKEGLTPELTTEQLGALVNKQEGIPASLKRSAPLFGRTDSRTLKKMGGHLAVVEKKLQARWQEYTQNIGQLLPWINRMKAMDSEKQKLIVRILDGSMPEDMVRHQPQDVRAMVNVMRHWFKKAAKEGKAAGLTTADGARLFEEMKTAYVVHKKAPQKDSPRPTFAGQPNDGTLGAASGSVNERDAIAGPAETAEDLFNYFDTWFLEVAEKRQFGKSIRIDEKKVGGMVTRQAEFIPQGEQLTAGIANEAAAARTLGHSEGEVSLMTKVLEASLGAKEPTDIITAGIIKKHLIPLLGIIHLPLSTINNAMQLTNNLLKLDTKNLAEALFDFADSHSRELAMRTGAPTQLMVRELTSGTGSRLQNALTKLLDKNLFTTVERMNRTVTTLAAMRWADEAAVRAMKGSQRDLKELAEWGVELQPGMGLTSAQREAVGLKMTEYLQHGTRPEDLPLYWRKSAFGKLMTLYQGYPLKQAYLMVDEIFAPMITGQGKGRERAVKDVIRFAAAGIPLYVIADMLNDIMRMREPWEKEGADRLWSVGVGLAGLGIVHETLQSILAGHLPAPVVLDDMRAIADVGSEMIQEGPADSFDKMAEGTSAVNDLLAKTPLTAWAQNLTPAGRSRQEEIYDKRREMREERAESFRDAADFIWQKGIKGVGVRPGAK